MQRQIGTRVEDLGIWVVEPSHNCRCKTDMVVAVNFGTAWFINLCARFIARDTPDEA